MLAISIYNGCCWFNNYTLKCFTVVSIPIIVGMLTTYLKITTKQINNLIDTKIMEVNWLMSNKYIYWKEDLKVEKYANGAIKMTVNDNKGYNSIHFKKYYIINEASLEILLLIDGTKKYDEIVEYLSAKYNENTESINNKVHKFLDTMFSKYQIGLDYQKDSIKRNIDMLTGAPIYPSVSSIELTSKCNIKCLHCYGEYNNTLKDVMPLEKAKSLLKELNNLGVNIIELTGGEITVYPYLLEIVNYALKLDFQHIALLTNGVAISDDLMNLIINNKERFVVQVDLHSMNDEYLTWFTKVPNTLERVKNNIIKLAENNVFMRVATIITPKNLYELESIADWVHKLGITKYGVSTVLNVGRAKEMGDELLITDGMKLIEIFNKINNKYNNFIQIIEDGFLSKKNCGCITSHVTIGANGNIKLCTMDNTKYFNSVIGNVFEESIKDIYDKNADYINEIFNIDAPKHDSVECNKCENVVFCSSCILRGLIKASELKESCQWYKNKVSQKIKSKLII